jgi:hypothetical protein
MRIKDWLKKTLSKICVCGENRKEHAPLRAHIKARAGKEKTIDESIFERVKTCTLFLHVLMHHFICQNLMRTLCHLLNAA